MKITLEGKVALITGGGAGIGRAIAEAFADLGAAVAIADNNAARADAVEAHFRARGQDALVSRTDVRDRAQVDACLAAVEARYGKLHVLVNNVGDFLQPGRFENHTEEDWDRLYDINLKQVFRVTKAALPLLRRASGDRSIITVSSIEGYRGMPFCPVYATFKAGLTGFTKSLALDLGPEGIRANVIAPETTDTEQVKIDALISPQYREHIPRWIPLGRFGLPSDCAGCAVFLATELSAWVTGTTIHVDGGALAAAGFYRTPSGRWTNAPVVVDSGFPV
ncbi:MAG: short-chain dehydrogenase [Deltaproteobacteria bacterium]|nr:short-chain dehydrogenase [Deltaproteobacteria bacterium]